MRTHYKHISTYICTCWHHTTLDSKPYAAKEEETVLEVTHLHFEYHR